MAPLAPPLATPMLTGGILVKNDNFATTSTISSYMKVMKVADQEKRFNEFFHNMQITKELQEPRCNMWKVTTECE